MSLPSKESLPFSEPPKEPECQVVCDVHGYIGTAPSSTLALTMMQKHAKKEQGCHSVLIIPEGWKPWNPAGAKGIDQRPKFATGEVADYKT